MAMWAVLLFVASFAPAQAASGPPAVVRKAASAESARAAAALLTEAQLGASTEDLPWLLLYASEYSRLAGDTGPARDGFSRVAADFPQHAAREPSKVGLAVLNANGQADGNTLATLELISEAGVPGTLNGDRWLLVAAARESNPDGSKVREALRRAEASARGTTESARILAAVGAARKRLAPQQPARPAEDGRPGDLVAIEKIRGGLAEQQFASVSAAATSFAAAWPDSPFRREADYAAERAERKTPIRRNVVAVVLPLTGEYALPGGQLRDAIKLSAELAGGIELVVSDTFGSAEGCSKAVEKAVIEQGAAIILGPLTRAESLGCAPTAQALHTPMLSFTSAEEVLVVGDQIFRPYPSVADQVAALLDDMIGGRGWGRFAVANPRNAFGESSARTFRTLVEARGGVVSAAADYDPAATDFRSVAKVLGQKDYKARSGEFAEVQRAAKRNGGDPAKSTLPPRIDFDAIFVPDGYQRSALLASALAFEEFPIGGFRPRRDDVPLGLVGLNAWNNPEWPRRGGDYVQGCLFVDAFRADDARNEVRKFVERWRERDAGDPGVVQAVGYDALGVAAAALRAPGPDVALNLLALDLPATLTGMHGFTVERTARRDFTLLTVRGDRVESLYGGSDGE
jgi:branched-chain amino acid transport system substrate-binding protein